jgi:hypothetical protein
MQDEPTSGMDAPKPEPTVADAFQEAKEAFAAAGSVIGANVKKAVKKAKKAMRKTAKKKAKPARKKAAKKKAAKKAKKKTARKSKARKVAKKAKKKTARRKAGKARSKRARDRRTGGRKRGASVAPLSFHSPQGRIAVLRPSPPAAMRRSTSGRSSSDADAVTKASALT